MTLTPRAVRLIVVACCLLLFLLLLLLLLLLFYTFCCCHCHHYLLLLKLKRIRTSDLAGVDTAGPYVKDAWSIFYYSEYQVHVQ